MAALADLPWLVEVGDRTLLRSTSSFIQQSHEFVIPDRIGLQGGGNPSTARIEPFSLFLMVGAYVGSIFFFKQEDR